MSLMTPKKHKVFESGIAQNLPSYTNFMDLKIQ